MPLGQILLEAKAVDPGNLLKALALQQREDVRLGDILLAQGWVSEPALMAALAKQWSAKVVDLQTDRPDPRLIDAFGADLCLTQGIVPLRRVGGTTVIATSRPEAFLTLRAQLPPAYHPFAMVLAPETAIHAALLAQRQTSLIRRAEASVPLQESCRGRDEARLAGLCWGLLVAAALALILIPAAVVMLLFCWAILSLMAVSALKLLAFLSEVRHQARRARQPATPPPQLLGRLPVVSVMVPMFREPDIAPRLVARLGALDYPRELLDILLVLEEEDHLTRTALANASLPPWMRLVVVPAGPIRTKPRALNFALNFCRGSVIGVYDAEDAPAPDQLHRVVRAFGTAGPDLACVQGVLDYYNPRTNWLARCFTIEYAAWFRAMLPGLARLGLVVPLGGTTLFFRRKILEDLGGWDAWNVTEDADLGLRLARHGYRCAVLETVTQEEANCRPLPWIKQRSRWLKGYAMTWGVHMRDPGLLYRQLGFWRFCAVQVQFLGTLSQYLLAPLLWSCWLMAFGLPHPLQVYMPDGAQGGLIALFVMTEALNIAVGLWAVRGKGHRFLWPWVPSLHLYHPLGALAGWKAIYEVISKPFYWDKTQHGLFDLTPRTTPPGDPQPVEIIVQNRL
ncbi:glycosyltransferase family 2 protein [Phaeovulum sp. W22_SRMD_FR3]